MTRLPLTAMLLLASLAARAAPVERHLYVPGDADAASNGQALAAAVAATGQAPGLPWLIQLGPGQFNLSPGTLELPAGVNLAGAGRHATTLRLNVSGGPQRPTLRTLGGNEVSRLQVIGSCFGGVHDCTGIEVPAGASGVRLNDVMVFTTGGAGSNAGVAVAGSVAIDGSLVLAQTGKRAVAVDLSGAGVVAVAQSDLRALSASVACETLGGKSTASEASQVRHSALYPFCFGGASTYWLRSSTAVPLRLAYTQIVTGSRSGTASCVATQASPGFLAQGCPD